MQNKSLTYEYKLNSYLEEKRDYEAFIEYLGVEQHKGGCNKYV